MRANLRSWQFLETSSDAAEQPAQRTVRYCRLLNIHIQQVFAAADRPARRSAHHAVHTDIDSQCDKLVTDDGHQFTTLTVHLST